MSTIKRTDLVNYITGVAGAAAAYGLLIKNIKYVEGFTKGLTHFFIIVASLVSGWLAAWIINQIQGQNHNTAKEVNKEQLRAFTAGAITTGTLVIVNAKNGANIAYFGLSAFVVAVALWSYGYFKAKRES